MIFRTAYRITGNAADAEDVLQTIFLRLLRQPPGAAPLDQEESYLRRAAVNASLDLIRQKQTARSVPINEAALPAAQPTSSATAADSGIKECLRRALRTLTERAAEIFTLRYFEDLSYEQMATALGCSMGTVASRLSRGHKMLAAKLGDLRKTGC